MDFVKNLSYMTLLMMALCVTSCRRFTITTSHTIDTKDYTLTVHGQRLRFDAQVAAFPVDTFQKFGDTVRLHNDVFWVAENLDNLSKGFCRFGDRYLDKGYYVLNLELIHKPGSNHEPGPPSPTCVTGATLPSIPSFRVTLQLSAREPETPLT